MTTFERILNSLGIDDFDRLVENYEFSSLIGQKTIRLLEHAKEDDLQAMKIWTDVVNRNAWIDLILAKDRTDMRFAVDGIRCQLYYSEYFNNLDIADVTDIVDPLFDTNKRVLSSILTQDRSLLENGCARDVATFRCIDMVEIPFYHITSRIAAENILTERKIVGLSSLIQGALCSHCPIGQYLYAYPFQPSDMWIEKYMKYRQNDHETVLIQGTLKTNELWVGKETTILTEQDIQPELIVHNSAIDFDSLTVTELTF